jgi:phosphoserine phosphatase
MDQLLVVIASTGSRALDAGAMAHVRPLLEGAPRWLAEDEAAEAPLKPGLGPDAVADLRRRLAGRPVDVCVVPAAHRQKRLLIADMDSTIIEQECIDELAVEAGIGEPIKAITARAMRGELVFEEALRERVALLAGLPETIIARVIAGRISYRPGARTLVATMRAHGAFTALVSGGFSQFTGAVARACGFHIHQANELLIAGGRLTGRVKEPILGSTAKVDALNTLARRRAIATADVLAVGDGANDMPMLQLAGLGVAMHAKPVVRAAAAAVIDHGDLTGLLYLQGYAANEWTTG